MNLSNKTTNDKITAVQIESGRLSYKTLGDGKPSVWWSGYVEVDSVGLLIEHLKTVARAEGKATTERKLVDRIFKGEALGLYKIGEFQVQVIV